MAQRLLEVLEGKGGNYILPFFWQHGEEEPVLRDYMQAIDGCGIKAVCVEARPHPDFAGPGWWRDMDIILDEARKREMKVWILDDAHFPTGYANGALKKADSKLCKLYLGMNVVEVVGPMKGARLEIEPLIHNHENPLMERIIDKVEHRTFDDNSLLAVIGGKVWEDDILEGEMEDLTGHVKNGWLTLDVPAGVWRIFVLYKTHNGGGQPHYINVLDRDSCRVLIDAVYEPHYKKYAADFGTTIAGFFSDEPSVGNTVGFDLDESIGRRKMLLSWCSAMDFEMAKVFGEKWTSQLPFLWYEHKNEKKSSAARFYYMDGVSRQIRDSFSRQIGQWCREHHVEYIGHMVEDGNQHSRLGSGMAHFFRSMAGQHMAGIDVIGGQVVAGAPFSHRLRVSNGLWNGDFFHFALGKLGSSLGHIDPVKEGRSVCEIFGAYGWESGVKNMKYLTDHFLVQGINHFVPHAFSPRPFPDPDSPPHFYNHGNDAQFHQFSRLMTYMNRMCHLFNGGTHEADVALLYHGESEWCGDCMYDEKPARQMMEKQVDFDIVPSDVLEDSDYFHSYLTGNYISTGRATALLLSHMPGLCREAL